MKIEDAKNKLWQEIRKNEGVEGIGITIENGQNVIRVFTTDYCEELPEEYEGHKVVCQNTGKFFFL